MKLIRCLFSALTLCILVLLPPMEALAQSENSEMQAVEVPQALGPEAMQALVSKLNDKQTSALVELIQLLDSSAGNSETTNLTEDQKKAISAAASQAAEPDTVAGPKV